LEQKSNLSFDNINMTELMNEIAEIKTLLQSMADDKAKEKVTAEEVEKAKAQKDLLQQINKATASALENLKKL
jgi:hypothetical protein